MENVYLKIGLAYFLLHRIYIFVQTKKGKVLCKNIYKKCGIFAILLSLVTTKQVILKEKKKVKFLKIWCPIREGKVFLSGEKQDLVVCDLKPGTLLYNPFTICTVLCLQQRDREKALALQTSGMSVRHDSSMSVPLVASSELHKTSKNNGCFFLNLV